MLKLNTKHMLLRHTLTGDSCIFKVGAIMNTKWIRGAVHKSCFSPSASHLVQEDGSSSLAKEGPGTSNCTCNPSDGMLHYLSKREAGISNQF